MSVFEVNRNPSRRDLRVFGWSMLGGFAILGMILWYVAYHKADPPRELLDWTGQAIQMVVVCMWALGLVLWLLSVVSLSATRRVYIMWMSGAVPVGVFMTNVLLTLLFITVLVPFALIRFGDPLRMKQKTGGTCWEDHKPHEPTLDRMMRPF